MSCLKLKNCAVIVLAATFCLFIAAGFAAPKTAPIRPRRQRRLCRPLHRGPMTRASPTRPRSFWKTCNIPCNRSTSPCRKSFSTATLRSLDPRRENFLQSDIDGFAHYRTNLDTFTVGGRGRSDLTPAYEIFRRFLERFTQHTDYVNQLLKQDRFKFNTDETHYA